MSADDREDRRRLRGFRIAAALGLGAAMLAVLALSATVLVFGPAPGTPEYPVAEFGYDYDAGDASLRVVHEGGATYDRNNTDRLVVTLDGRTAAAFGLPAAEGAAVTVSPVADGTTVRVVWVNGDRRVPVGRTTVGGNATTSPPV